MDNKKYLQEIRNIILNFGYRGMCEPDIVIPFADGQLDIIEEVEEMMDTEDAFMWFDFKVIDIYQGDGKFIKGLYIFPSE